MLTKILENEDLIEILKKMFFGGLLVLYPRRQRHKKYLTLDKIGEAYKCDDCKVTVSHLSCLSRSIIDSGKKCPE